ncbi:MAG: hypothetical protein WEB37_13325 [Bacteroidota bacterium]
MLFLKIVLSQPRFRTLLFVLTILSLVCTQIPLLNYLGFEFAVLMSIVGSYSAGLLALVLAPHASENTYKHFTLSAGAGLLLLVPPLMIISANALFVRNCSFAGGLTIYLLGPVPAVIFVVALAVLVTSLVSRWRKTVLTIAVIAVLSHILVVTLISPQIFAFNPILGYFPGITYDESLRIGSSLFQFRILTVIIAAVLLLAADMVRGRKAKAPVSQTKRIVLIVGGVFLVSAYWFSDRLGFSSSEEFIRAELGGVYESEHFTILYPKDAVTTEEIERLAARHEFHFNTIARELRILPVRKIRSFLYASAEQKGRLIGAAGTNIAKPWRWELHVNLNDVNRVLKHEMVHIMAADFGFPLLRISLNSGLIEGLAMAVERVEYDETLHRLAAQIFATGLRPDVESLFSVSGFLKSHGGTSYVLAGSFCRYLIDQYGMRRFKWLYRTGSFESFYNKELPVLIAEWRRFISVPEPSVSERTRAAYMFRRPSIFGRECARVIAEVNEETRNAMRRGDFEAAVELSRRSLELTRSPEAILQHANALLRSGRSEAAIEFGTEALADSMITHTLLPLYLTLGDAHWKLGNALEAGRLYDALYSVHLSPAYDEACGIRRFGLRDPSGEQLREFILGDVADSLRIPWLESGMAKSRFSQLLPYLLGRELIAEKRMDEARRTLMLPRPMSMGVLEFFRLRRLATVHLELKEYEKVKICLWESLNYTTKESHRFENEELIRWCDWLEGREL